MSGLGYSGARRAAGKFQGRIAGSALVLGPLLSLFTGSLPPLAALGEDPVMSLMQCTPLPNPTSQHGCSVVGSRLYVFGGFSDGIWENRVFSYDITGPGKLGTWRAERAMPESRSYISTSVEAVNNRIYIVGGSVAYESGPKAHLKNSEDVFMTTVLEDGTLGFWQRSSGFPGLAASCAATCSTDKFLYLTGGNSQGNPSQTIVRAELAADGTPRKWIQAGEMPTPLWFHGATILNERMYIWGGLTEKANSAISKKAYSAPVRKDGTIRDWREETPMPAPVYSSAFCGFNDYLISVGGRYVNGYPTNVIWYSRLQKGKPGPWQFLKTDSPSMAYLSLGLDKATGVVYVVGGQYKTRPGDQIEKILDAVQAFHMAQPQSAKVQVTDVPGAIGSQIPTLPEALEMARQQNKPALAFFYSPEVPACKPFWSKLQKNGTLERAKDGFITAAVDISGSDSSLSSKYSVYTVPCLVRISKDDKAYGWAFRADEVTLD